VGLIFIDLSNGDVFIAGRVIHHLTSQVRLFVTMIRNEGCVLSREELRSAAWDDEVHLRSVDKEITPLKKRLRFAKTKCSIKCIRGFGYAYFVRKYNAPRRSASEQSQRAAGTAEKHPDSSVRRRIAAI